ncbi:hypothetical protein PAXRUDRAFT_19774 [Paxillus rubicundulus Ve08.2h10]|uniref:Uncharacterized protein n=1 Tax=Paxillus rubicundulus Ve08.2h10 TaxID=930991 RepID=A0A0D0D3M1_9AGAM|nr:hypothetical protein PAXRUDRAFT_19774 [Paxillus rubicundulus Ve08.2h10]
MVKAKGCWKSNTFQLYLLKHAQLLAIHMQKHLSLHEEFIRYTMPTTDSSCFLKALCAFAQPLMLLHFT